MTFSTKQIEKPIPLEWMKYSTDLKKIREFLGDHSTMGAESQVEQENIRRCFWNIYQNYEDRLHSFYLKEEQSLKVKTRRFEHMAFDVLKSDSSSTPAPPSSIEKFDRLALFDTYIRQAKKLQIEFDTLQDFLHSNHIALSQIVNQYENNTGYDASDEDLSCFRECKLCSNENSLIYFRNKILAINDLFFQRKKTLLSSGERKTRKSTGRMRSYTRAVSQSIRNFNSRRSTILDREKSPTCAICDM
jgi:hypothetical protein